MSSSYSTLTQLLLLPYPPLGLVRDDKIFYASSIFLCIFAVTNESEKNVLPVCRQMTHGAHALIAERWLWWVQRNVAFATSVHSVSCCYSDYTGCDNISISFYWDYLTTKSKKFFLNLFIFQFSIFNFFRIFAFSKHCALRRKEFSIR